MTNRTDKTTLKAVLMAGAMMGVVAATGAAWAATAVSNMTVTASVGASCTISTTPLAFGLYDPVSANATVPADATSSVIVTCTQGAVATVALDNGLQPSGSQRQLAAGIERLNYDIFSDSGRSTAWNATTMVTTTGSGVAQTYTAYGRIPAGQTAANAGSYSDTVVATVNF